jgi:hypothetical protein
MTMSLSGMVQQGLDNRRKMMDVCRVVAPSSVVVALMADISRSMPWFLLKMCQRNIVAAIFWACAMVCIKGLVDRFVLQSRYWAFCWGLQLLVDVSRCEVQAWAPTWPPIHQAVRIATPVINEAASVCYFLYFSCKNSNIFIDIDLRTGSRVLHPSKRAEHGYIVWQSGSGNL